MSLNITPTFTSFTGAVVRAGFGGLFWRGTVSAAGWSLSVPRSTLCSGRLSACLVPKRALPSLFCSLQQQCVCAPELSSLRNNIPHLTASNSNFVAKNKTQSSKPLPWIFKFYDRFFLNVCFLFVFLTFPEIC